MSQREVPGLGNETVKLVDATSGNETVTLPANYAVGRRFTVRRADSSANTVTVSLGNPADSLDGATNGTTTVSGNNEKGFLLGNPGLWRSFGGANPVALAADPAFGAKFSSKIDTVLKALPKSDSSVYAMSTEAVVVSCSLASAATSITSAFMVQPKKTPGASSPIPVDMAGDENYCWIKTPSLQYGASFPDSALIRAPLLTGGGSQAAYWSPAMRFYYDGRYLEASFKCLVAAQCGFALRIDGKRVVPTFAAGTTGTCSPEGTALVSANSAGNLAAGGFYLLKFDLGSTGTMRMIELDFGFPFQGFWIEPTASFTRGPEPKLIFCGVGDSLTGGAGTATRSENYVSRLGELLGCDVSTNIGIGGTGYINSPGTNDFQTRVPDVIAAKPDILTVWGGQNDQAQTPAAFKTAVDLFLSSVKTALPKTIVFVIGMWSPGNANATRITFNNILKQAASDAGYFFIDMIDPRGNGATAAAWAAGTVYAVGDVVTSGTVPYKCIVGHTSSGGAIDTTKFLGTSFVNGLGRVGNTTSLGNADVMVQADAIHQTALCNDLLERKFAGEIIRILRGAAA